jgi:hypothetical protein
MNPKTEKVKELSMMKPIGNDENHSPNRCNDDDVMKTIMMTPPKDDIRMDGTTGSSSPHYYHGYFPPLPTTSWNHKNKKNSTSATKTKHNMSFGIVRSDTNKKENDVVRTEKTIYLVFVQSFCFVLNSLYYDLSS